MEKIKNFFFAVSLLYLSLYLPTAFMTYFPGWYTFNCKLHPRCEMIGNANAARFIDELTGFFLHLGQLNGNWTAKERFHLLEVRDILDVAACIAGICILLLIVTFNRSTLPFYSTVNLLIILSLLILLPFFKFFWVKIFHPLFFSNNLWLNNSFDRSFYIMPGVFFKHSLIFLVSSAALLNGLIRVFARKR